MRAILLSLIFILVGCDPASVGVIEFPYQSKNGRRMDGKSAQKYTSVLHVIDRVRSITLQMGGRVTPVRQSNIKLETGQQVKSFLIGILLPAQNSNPSIKANCNAYISDTGNVILKVWEWQKFNQSPQVREFIKRLREEVAEINAH
jgi:hypothetical protein